MLLQKIFYYLTLMMTNVLLCAETEEENKESTKEYGIVIFPSAEVALEAARMNTSLAKRLPEINNLRNFWHVNLYHFSCTKSNLDLAIRELRTLSVEPFNLKFHRIYSVENRWINWAVENSTDLESLHRRAVDIANPHRTGRLKRADDIYEELDNEMQQQVDTYGVSSVLEFYDPHLTLFYAYPPNHSLSEAFEETTIEKSCEANGLGLVELGYNGNLTEIVQCINFRKK